MTDLIQDHRPALPGSVSLDYIELSSSRNNIFVDITQLVFNIDIFEDIFSPFVYGKLHIFDTQNITNLFPIIGEETVKIKYSTEWINRTDENEQVINTSNTTSVERSFWVYALTDRIKTNNAEHYYVLHFASHELKNDLFYKLSKAYRGSVSDIAQEIYANSFYYNEIDSFERGFFDQWIQKNPNKTKLDYVKDQTTDTFLVEQTGNSIKYISNYWSPSKNLLYLAKIAQSPKYKTTDYVFFDSLTFGHSFISLSEAINRSQTNSDTYRFTYIADNYSADADLRTYNRVNSWKVNTQFDYLERYKRGMIGIKTFSHDFINKKINIDKLKYGDISQPELNKYPLQSKNEYPFPNQENGYGLYIGGVVSDTYNGRLYTQQSPVNKMQRLMRVENSTHSKSLTVSLHGRVDMTLLDTINLSVFKAASNSIDDQYRDDMLDLNLSGNYIITAIKHSISKTGYEMHVELCSDSSIVSDINTLNPIVNVNSGV